MSRVQVAEGTHGLPLQETSAIRLKIFFVGTSALAGGVSSVGLSCGAPLSEIRHELILMMFYGKIRIVQF